MWNRQKFHCNLLTRHIIYYKYNLHIFVSVHLNMMSHGINILQRSNVAYKLYGIFLYLQWFKLQLYSETTVQIAASLLASNQVKINKLLNTAVKFYKRYTICSNWVVYGYRENNSRRFVACNACFRGFFAVPIQSSLILFWWAQTAMEVASSVNANQIKKRKVCLSYYIKKLRFHRQNVCLVV
jgi:hypothetical protein